MEVPSRSNFEAAYPGAWFGIVEKHLKPAFPGALRAITAADAEAYIKNRLAEKPCGQCKQGKTASHAVCSRCSGLWKLPDANPATINRELTVLKHMIARAVDWEYLGGNRLAKVKQLRESPGRTRFLAREEIDRLLDACSVENSESTLARGY
jgi:hypothetical protein